MQDDGRDPWDRDDLIRRVQQALDLAGWAVAAAAAQGPETEADGGRGTDRNAEDQRTEPRPLVLAKVVAEAAMLLRCAAFLRDTDDRIACTVDDLARRLIPHARGDALLAALCREPALALDRAAAHIHLSDLGYRDAAVDRMLGEILQGEDVGGPERLPNHDLERHWLGRIWSGADDDASADAELVARTCIARPLDALGSTTADLYAFTHTVLYASDMGRRSPQWPRQSDELVADAEAALAAAVDSDNLDLAAELLWTWPMLGLAWSPVATFGFGILAATQDAHGFLPGPGYSASECVRLPEALRHAHVLRTSYHATFVIGFLCAAALRSGLAPPVAVTQQEVARGAVDVILPLVRQRPQEPCWRGFLLDLDRGRREQLAEFLLTVALRRARASQDLELLRECLRVGLQCDLVDGPAAHQALALLRRATMLGRISSDVRSPVADTSAVVREPGIGGRRRDVDTGVDKCEEEGEPVPVFVSGRRGRGPTMPAAKTSHKI